MDEMQTIAKANLRATENIIKAIQAMDADTTISDVLTMLSFRAEAIRELMPEASAKQVKTRTLTESDPEPSIGSVVQDRDNDIWHRRPDGTWSMAGYPDERGYDFLKNTYGPLVLISNP